MLINRATLIIAFGCDFGANFKCIVTCTYEKIPRNFNSKLEFNYY